MGFWLKLRCALMGHVVDFKKYRDRLRRPQRNRIKVECIECNRVEKLGKIRLRMAPNHD